MKIFVNRKIRRNPWGGGIHFLSSLVDYSASLGHVFTNSYDNDVDVILMMDPRPDEGFGGINHLISFKNHLKSIGKSVRVVHRINDTDIARGTNFLVELNMKSNLAIADDTIFISEWLKNHYESHGFSRESTVITNGCNRNWFFPKIDERTSEVIKVVTHHWSDNYNKGFDAYIALDKELKDYPEIEFTFVGRYYKGYVPSNTKIIPPLYGLQLGDELRKHDVYLTAARWEACGMHHIEASSCGLPVLYHRDGGGVNEICKSHGVEFDRLDQLPSLIKSLHKQRNSLISKLDYQKFDSDIVSKKYLSILERKT